jgi:Ca2+/Na+ antiporter
MGEHFSDGFPDSAFTQDQLKNGAVVLPILGIIYLYIGIYILNTRYFYPAIEYFIGLIEEKYRAAAYCFLNSFMYLFVMLYSTMLANDSIGITTIMGSDAINLLFVMGLVQWRAKIEYEMEFWVFIKESVLYLITLALAVVFFSFKKFYWWMSIIWLGVFAIYAIFLQARNEDLRDKLAQALGLKVEEDAFSSEENYKMVKRRSSITELAEKNCIDNNDFELNRKIRRQEAGLLIMIRDAKKFNIYYHFQRAVFRVEHALKNEAEIAKRERSRVFKEKVDALNTKSPKKQPTIKADEVKSSKVLNELGDLNDKRDEEENLLSRDRIMSQNLGNELSPRNPKGFSQDDILSRASKVENERSPREKDIFDMVPQDEQPVEARKTATEMYDIEDALTIPDSLIQKVVYFVLFPLNFVFYVMLYYFKKQVNFQTTSFFIITILAIQAGLCYLIIFWTEIIVFGLDIPSEVAGLSWTSIGFSVSFIVYNMKLQSVDKDSNFLTTFEMVGIYKFTFAAPIGWLLGFLKHKSGSNDFIIFGFNITTIIYFVLFAASGVWIGIRKGKISKKMSIPYLSGYLVFLITAIALTASLTSTDY